MNIQLFQKDKDQFIYGEQIKLENKPITDFSRHLLTEFSCGNEEIDKYFKEDAASDTQAVSKMFINKDNKDIVCVYSLSCSGFCIELYDKTYIAPAVELKFFAMNQKYQDIQYSEDEEDGVLSAWLLSSVLSDVFSFTESTCGADKVILFSVPDAVEFYRTNGFSPCEEFMKTTQHRYLDGCTPMYMDL